MMDKMAIVISLLSLAVCLANFLLVFKMSSVLKGPGEKDGQDRRIPNLTCWLFGHKWWIRNTQEKMEYRPDLGEVIKVQSITSTQRPNCERCGAGNPGFGKE